MKNWISLGILALGLLLMPSGLRAAETVKLNQRFNTLSAQVTQIDRATHTLTLLNDRHETIEIQVDPAKVKNFNNIKVGDNVVVRSSQSIALSLQKPTTAAGMTMEAAPPGAKPSLSGENTETIQGEIVGIDKPNMMVSLKGPKGNIVNVLAKDPARLENLKVGDKVWATFTKSVAISVEPAPQKPM